MIDVLLVKIDDSNLICCAKSNLDDLKKNDRVLIKINDVLFCGTVVKEKYSEKTSNIDDEIFFVNKKIDDDDLKIINKNSNDSIISLNFAKKTAKELELDMNFINCFYSFDRKQLIFYFLSDNRVDFRELAKRLASKFKTRIELTQIGVRDKAKKIGGIGPCGLYLCCNSFLSDFDSVSINMAKNQNITLNPSKINGVCGRLLCCLGYENNTYSELRKDLPKVGLIADTQYGMGKVTEVDVLKGTYKVNIKDKGIFEISKEDINGKN